MLRGGPLAEPRVIELVNRRFVLFYFNVGRGQKGYDLEAAAFIALHDDRFAGGSVPTPPVWVFSPEEELIDTIDNYTPKDEFFAALRSVLDGHPELDRPTRAEASVLEGEDPLAAARLAEDLGHYELAGRLYRTGFERGRLQARFGLARIARYTGDLPEVERQLKNLEEQLDDAPEHKDDFAMELAYLMLARDDHATARTTLVEAIRTHPDSSRMGELHFYAGVAAFLCGERAWADFHWCWVMENIPADYNYMRCYLAATADAMPYPNPELGGYRGETNMISHALADEARAKALKNYEALKPEWER